MRIAIITLSLHANYGGVLQAYALQSVLKQMGHTVETLQTPYFKKLPLWRKPLTYSKRVILKYFLGKKVRIFHERWYNTTEPSLVKHIERFIGEYISVRMVNRYTDLCKDDFDAFIVGSDQIWRPMYFEQPIEIAYLSFTKNWNGIKRLAYAASFGTDKWEYTRKQSSKCSQLVKHFNAISVREKTAIDLCKQNLGRKAQHVLDPTMLLTLNDYCKLFENKQISLKKRELLTYILDENSQTQHIVSQLANKLNLISFRINSSYENFDAPISERIQPPVEQWLKGFYEAKFVITDSFHATVFSILFGKPFIVIGNKERGISRLESLLSMFGLEKHFVLIDEEVNLDMDFNLNTQRIDSILNRMRAESIDFLTEHLNN